MRRYTKRREKGLKAERREEVEEGTKLRKQRILRKKGLIAQGREKKGRDEEYEKEGEGTES